MEEQQKLAEENRGLKEELLEVKGRLDSLHSQRRITCAPLSTPLFTKQQVRLIIYHLVEGQGLFQISSVAMIAIFSFAVGRGMQTMPVPLIIHAFNHILKCIPTC